MQLEAALMDEEFGRDVAALKQQVREIESSMSTIATQMSSISEELRTVRQPNYSLLIGAAAAAFAMIIYYGELTKRPLQDQAERNRKDIETIDQSLVPRGEHQQIWLSFSRQIEAIQRQTDEQKAALGGVYSPRDALLRIEERLTTLEQNRNQKE